MKAEELKAKIEREKLERTAKLEKEARELEATKIEVSEAPKTVGKSEEIKEDSFSKTDKPKNVFRNYILALLLIGGGVFGYWQLGGSIKETSSYKIYGDVFVDKSTNLMWQKKNSSNMEDEFTWQEAKSYCSNLNLGGFSDWKLPTREEAKTLLTEYYGTYNSRWFNWFDRNKHKQYNNRFVKKEISESAPLWIWILTINKIYSSESWSVSFNAGRGFWGHQTVSSYAVCVRDM
jgi:hypothetical protein